MKLVTHLKKDRKGETETEREADSETETEAERDREIYIRGDSIT